MKLSAKFAAKTTFAAFALAGSFAAFAPAAQALPVPPPGPASTSLDFACYTLQQDYISGVAEYKAAHNAGDQAGMDAAGAKLRGAEDGWRAACRGVYGDIGTNRVAPPVTPNGVDPLTPDLKSDPTPNPKSASGTGNTAPSSASVN
ncbi:hypothetical protein [Mycolicibacterium stellerae]|uniref:hypothetical protein n=1 Tax=Mycolicibacterium stellerae TaxID=2358193 RepID=UPI000F0B94BD|nr:hypothetical protein [Mycolicibacterium stellerae]